MPSLDGIETTAGIKERFGTVNVSVLRAFDYPSLEGVRRPGS
jgi:hypothetical protein